MPARPTQLHHPATPSPRPRSHDAAHASASDPTPPTPPAVPRPAQEAIEASVRDVLTKAGKGRHILNLGHGVLVGTPEEGVAHMFNLSKSIKY